MDYDVTIIGGGILGCAIASVLSRKYSVLLLEKNHDVGLETSARSGEVIHTGINYLDHPFKGSLCMEGNRIMYKWCEMFNVPYRRWGKLIVAKEGEEKVAEELCKKGVDAGLDLCMIDKSALNRLEPNIDAVCAIWSPNTGIVDTRALLLSYLGAAERSNLDVYPNMEVVGVDRIPGGGFSVAVAGEDERVKSTYLVNAAGLYADKVAMMCGINGLSFEIRLYKDDCFSVRVPKAKRHYLVNAANLNADTIAEMCYDPSYEIQFCKGNYFSVRIPKDKRINHLIYPTPGPVSQGFHVKLELDHQMKIGPDTNFIKKDDANYVVDESVIPQIREKFTQRYFKFPVALEHITPGYAGIRPKLQKEGEPSRDWVFLWDDNLLTVLGYDSPGISASMACARYLGGEYFEIQNLLYL